MQMEKNQNAIMDEEKKGFVAWVKTHKTELILAGVSIGVIIAIILGIKNKETLVEMWGTLRALAKKPAVPGDGKSIDTSASEIIESSIAEITDSGRHVNYQFDVSDHIRNLHPGWTASAEKLAEADRLGIVLQPGQTLVDAYTKGGVAA